MASSAAASAHSSAAEDDSSDAKPQSGRAQQTVVGCQQENSSITVQHVDPVGLSLQHDQAKVTTTSASILKHPG